MVNREIWKPIIHDNRHEVSNFGRIRSLFILKRINNISNGRPKIKIVNTYISCGGYIRVDLRTINKDKTYRVHRLVAESFIPNSENKPQVNHINGIKNYNRVENLEWCSAHDNMLHAYKIGLIKPLLGENKCNAKLKERDIIEIRNLYKNNISIKSLSEQFNVNTKTIFSIVNFKRWKHVK